MAAARESAAARSHRFDARVRPQPAISWQCSAALRWMPLAARAQHAGKIPRIGLLTYGASPNGAFVQRLSDLRDAAAHLARFETLWR